MSIRFSRLVCLFQALHRTLSRNSINGYECVCAPYCAKTTRKDAGRSRHIRWPNVHFTKHGLFSLVTAHAQTVSPLVVTINWRAVCGKPPVRFGGRGGANQLPYPIWLNKLLVTFKTRSKCGIRNYDAPVLIRPASTGLSGSVCPYFCGDHGLWYATRRARIAFVPAVRRAAVAG